MKYHCWVKKDFRHSCAEWGKSSHNKKWVMENLNFFYQDVGMSSSAGDHLTQEEATKEAIAIRMSKKFSLLEEERPIIETMAYNYKYKKILDEVWKEKVELDGKIVKEEEDAIEGQVNKNALVDTRLDINIMPYRIYETLGREDMKNVDRRITMINHTQAEAMGILPNVLCQVGVTTLIAKFLILDIPIDYDSPIVVGRGFLRTIGAIVNTPERLFSTFDGFCHQTFRVARSDFMRNAKSDSDDEEDYQIKRNKFGSPIYGPKPTPYLNWIHNEENRQEVIKIIGIHDDEVGSSRSKRPRQHETVEEIRAFNINEPNYVELCHEFYSTYEFDEVCVDDELQTKKIIKFRLGRRAHSLTLLEFARRLELYQAVELKEEGFNVYFEGGLRNDEHFNRTTGYDKIQKNDLWLLSMFDARHQNGYANVAWVIARWIKKKGARTQKESQICYGQFILKIARKCRVLTEDVGVFEHMDGVYSVPLHGAYNPLGYAQPQYDQYYQQYPPPPPQYPPQYQQQQDNEYCRDEMSWSDFESWQQRIRLYYLGKDNRENIIKSIYEGPFKIGKFRETLVEGALHLGPEWDKVFVDLTLEENERFKADIRATNILLQGLPKDIYTLINHYTDAKDIYDNVKMLLEGSELTKDERLWFRMFRVDKTKVRGTMQREQLQLEMGDFRKELGMQILNSEYFKDKMLLMQTQENGVVLDEEQLLFIAGRQPNTFDDDVDEAPIQDLALNEDSVFEAEQCNAFDSDVDEAPTKQTMFMANLSSADPIYNEVGPSYDSNILSEVKDHDNYIDSYNTPFLGQSSGAHMGVIS
nr:integrase, catalytic region, zinc finger, CCHC-type, peptidase aspartic, catalytic [Tanacetum cinerariifolium]